MFNFEFKVDGVLTDADSVKLSSPTDAYGMRATATNEVIIADDTPFSRTGVGLYQYDESALTFVTDVIYDYWIEVVYDSEITRVQRFLIGAGGYLTQKVLRFVCIEGGEYIELESAPKLSSPTGSFGVARLDNGDIVAANNTPMIANGTMYAAAFGEPETGLKYRYYVSVEIDGVTYFIPRTTEYMYSANLLLGRYTDSTKVELQFGAENIHKWVGLDNGDEAVDYAMREYQCIVDAESEVDRLVQGHYIREAFGTGSEEEIPSIITRVATMLAGCLMYEARGATDFNDITGDLIHKYAAHRRNAEKILKNIKMGRTKLPQSYGASVPIAYDEI